MNLIQKIIHCNKIGGRRKRRAISALKELYPKGFIRTISTTPPDYAPNPRFCTKGGQFLPSYSTTKFEINQTIMNAVHWAEAPMYWRFWQRLHRHKL